MQKIPYELLDTICSFLSTPDLVALAQVSSQFRRSVIFPLAARFGISEFDIDSGMISLSDSFFLLPMLASVRPLQRLECFKQDKRGPYVDDIKKLIDILCAMAPIPDILIHDRYSISKSPVTVAYILSRLPQTKNSALLIVKHGSISVSRPRTAAQLQRTWWAPSLVIQDSTPRKLIMCFAHMFLAGVCFLTALLDIGPMVLGWYRRCFGPPLGEYLRIKEDVRPLYPGRWMRIDATIRIQVLPAQCGDFVLVTIAGELSRHLNLMHIPGLELDAYRDMLASLQLADHLVCLIIRKNSCLAHVDVMTFALRHPNLETLVFEPDSIAAIEPSIDREANTPHLLSALRNLSAPAAYIPDVISVAPSIERISITILGKTSSNLRDYHLALMSLATLPGTHPLILTLELLEGANLPWVHITPADGRSVEMQLHRVEQLVLRSHRPLNSLSDPTFVRWVAQFPALQRVTFNLGCLLPMTGAEKQALAAAIRDGCGNKGTDVVIR
ncbi:hypothetical protein DFH06DRAFT_1303982 [Mycena polygramma]|nr:hypothetical protein DFH06DRAFT_1303982 [Mycena polygramma]